MAWTTTDLLTEVRNTGMLPSATATATDDASLLLLADREIQSFFVPLLVSVREEWFVKYIDYTLSSYSTTGEIRLPSRAIASRLRSVQLFPNGTSAGNAINLARVETSDMGRFGVPSAGSGNPWAYYLRGSHLVLMPKPAVSSTASVLRVHYLARPGRLVATSSARQLTAITADKDYTGAASTGRTQLVWTSVFTLGATVDVAYNSPPFDLNVASASNNPGTGSVTAIDVATTSIEDASALAVGDWVSKADETPLIPLPVELHASLFVRTAAAALAGLGYLDEAKAAFEQSSSMAREVVRLLAPRTEGEARKQVGSILWRNRRGALGWGW